MVYMGKSMASPIEMDGHPYNTGVPVVNCH